MLAFGGIYTVRYVHLFQTQPAIWKYRLFYAKFIERDRCTCSQHLHSVTMQCLYADKLKEATLVCEVKVIVTLLPYAKMTLLTDTKPQQWLKCI